MSTILTMAEEIGRGLRQALLKVRQTVVRKLALAVGAMVELRTPNTSELANVLPFRDGARGYARTVVATVAEKSPGCQSRPAETVGVPSAGRGESARAARVTEPGSNRSGTSVCGLDAECGHR